MTNKSIQPVIELCSKYKDFPINQWIKIPDFHLDLYIRRTKRLIQGEAKDTIDLASFEIKEQYRSKGMFTQFIDLIEKYAKENSIVVYVECVHNERLRSFLTKRGYSYNTGEELCLFKKV